MSVRAERHSGHVVRVADQRAADGLAGVGVPQPNRLVPAGGGQPVPVRAEHRAIHLPDVAGERRADLLARVGVPQPHRGVGARGGQPTPVRAEHHVENVLSVAGERGTDLLARVGVPHPHRAVRVGRGEPLPVRAERHRPYRVDGAGEGLPDGLAGIRIPDPHRPVSAAIGQPVPVGADGHAVGRCSGVDDLGGSAAFDDGVEQATGCGIPRESMRGEEFLQGPDVAAGLGAGHHQFGLRHQPPSFRAVSLVHRFLSLIHRFLALAFGFLALHERDPRCGERANCQQHEAGDRGAAQPSEAALFAQIFACEFVFGFSVDRGGKICDLLAEHRCGGIPRCVIADVDIERLGHQNPGLREDGWRRIRAAGFKPSGAFVPGELSAREDEQQVPGPAVLQPVGDFLVDPARAGRVRRQHHDHVAGAVHRLGDLAPQIRAGGEIRGVAKHP